jgi:hypothetical protein
MGLYKFTAKTGNNFWMERQSRTLIWIELKSRAAG